MPCVDCQPEASSVAQSFAKAEGNGGCRGLTIWSITLNIGHDCFYYTESQSFTHLVYLCILGSFVKLKE